MCMSQQLNEDMTKANLKAVDSLAMLAAEVAFRCAEKGMNWEATKISIEKLLIQGDEEKS